MKKFKDPALFGHIKTYLTVYLPLTRRKSVNTVEAARYGLNLYIDYLRVANGIEINDISTADFNAGCISSFMGWLRDERKMRPHQSTKGCPRFALSADICLKMIY